MAGAQTAEGGLLSPKNVGSGKKAKIFASLRQSKSRESLRRSRASSVEDEEKKDPMPAHQWQETLRQNMQKPPHMLSGVVKASLRNQASPRRSQTKEYLQTINATG